MHMRLNQNGEDVIIVSHRDQANLFMCSIKAFVVLPPPGGSGNIAASIDRENYTPTSISAPHRSVHWRHSMKTVLLTGSVASFLEYTVFDR